MKMNPPWLPKISDTNCIDNGPWEVLTMVEPVPEAEPYPDVIRGLVGEPPLGMFAGGDGC